MTHFCVSLNILFQNVTYSKCHVIKGHVFIIRERTQPLAYVYRIPTQRHTQCMPNHKSSEIHNTHKEVIPQLEEADRWGFLLWYIVRKHGAGIRGADVKHQDAEQQPERLWWLWPAASCMMDLQAWLSKQPVIGSCNGYKVQYHRDTTEAWNTQKNNIADLCIIWYFPPGTGCPPERHKSLPPDLWSEGQTQESHLGTAVNHVLAKHTRSGEKFRKWWILN